VGCLRLILDVGIEGYVNRIVANQAKGIAYGLNGVYGGKSESEVLDMLGSGEDRE
jgi:hypothetical protein